MISFLLDEHYSEDIALILRENDVDAISIVQGRPNLIGANDVEVLRAATAERRAVVTEDVSTVGIAIGVEPRHSGVVYCHHRRFPRTLAGNARLAKALWRFASRPPRGLGVDGWVWWLDACP